MLAGWARVRRHRGRARRGGRPNDIFCPTTPHSPHASGGGGRPPRAHLSSELGGVAAMGSAVTGEVRLSDAAALGTLLAQCGFQLDAAAPLREVAEGLGRPLPAANGGERAVFSATKTRLTGVQHERLQEELERAEVEGGEEGFADAP